MKILITLYALSLNILCGQPRTIFFDYIADSIKAVRIVSATAPTTGQSFALTNSVITDYIGNSRICLFTGVITSKKDTVLALHSLTNGAGNLNIEFEIPLGYGLHNKSKYHDFNGLSLLQRVSVVIDQNQTFETSLISYELGLKLCGKLTGELGNLGVRYAFKNALVLGNNQFVKSSYGFTQNGFYFNSIELKLRTGANILVLNLPLLIVSLDNSVVKDFPVFVGYSLLF